MKLFITATLLLLSMPSYSNPVHEALQAAINKPVKQEQPKKHPRQAQYGLAFIFSSKCPYCHKFAPTLKTFAAQTGLPVYAFSVDGLGLPQYPNPLTATRDIVQEFYHTTSNITYPALFLVNLDNRKHVTLGLGNVPLSALQTTYQASMTLPHLKAQLQ
ncbi:conjugal transfer protein TraF [Photobacterium damselae]|uniref:conjugal transfer protein TraF n=1 Tax=Photobacterium damselae TaxID=38293 RepID=UPI0040676203